MEFDARKTGSPPPHLRAGRDGETADSAAYLSHPASLTLQEQGTTWPPEQAGRIWGILGSTGERHPRRMTGRQPGAGGVRTQGGFPPGFLYCLEDTLPILGVVEKKSRILTFRILALIFTLIEG